MKVCLRHWSAPDDLEEDDAVEQVDEHYYVECEQYFLHAQKIIGILLFSVQQLDRLHLGHRQHDDQRVDVQVEPEVADQSGPVS